MRTIQRRQGWWSLWYYTTTLFTALTTAQTCYAPNGTAVEISSVSSGSRLYACPAGSDGHSTCCAEGDFCHPDFLCYNLNGGQPTVRRQYCTDPTWGTPNCSPLCRHDADANSPSSGGAVLSPCLDGKFCCGAFQYNCCDDHNGEWAVQGHQVGAGISYVANSSSTQVIVVVTSGITSTLLPTTTPSSLQTSNSAPAPTSNSSSNTGLSGGTLAGVVVGASVGVGMICIAAALFFRKRRPSPADHPVMEQPHAQTYEQALEKSWHPQYSNISHHELPPSTRVGELPHGDMRHEMMS